MLLLLGAAVGVLAAYWWTRSLVVSLLPAAALCVAFVAQFIGDVPLAWAGALAVLMLLPQRAEGFDRPPPALPRR